MKGIFEKFKSGGMNFSQIPGLGNLKTWHIVALISGIAFGAVAVGIVGLFMKGEQVKEPRAREDLWLPKEEELVVPSGDLPQESGDPFAYIKRGKSAVEEKKVEEPKQEEAPPPVEEAQAEEEREGIRVGQLQQMKIPEMGSSGSGGLQKMETFGTRDVAAGKGQLRGFRQPQVAKRTKIGSKKAAAGSKKVGADRPGLTSKSSGFGSGPGFGTGVGGPTAMNVASAGGGSPEGGGGGNINNPPVTQIGGGDGGLGGGSTTTNEGDGCSGTSTGHICGRMTSIEDGLEIGAWDSSVVDCDHDTLYPDHDVRYPSQDNPSLCDTVDIEVAKADGSTPSVNRWRTVRLRADKQYHPFLIGQGNNTFQFYARNYNLGKNTASLEFTGQGGFEILDQCVEGDPSYYIARTRTDPVAMFIVIVNTGQGVAADDAECNRILHTENLCASAAICSGSGE